MKIWSVCISLTAYVIVKVLGNELQAFNFRLYRYFFDQNWFVFNLGFHLLYVLFWEALKCSTWATELSIRVDGEAIVHIMPQKGEKH